MEFLDWIYIVRYIVGVIGGVWLITYNQLINVNETDSKVVGYVFGSVLLFPCLQYLISGERMYFLAEAFLYLAGGIYLIREHWVSYESARIRISFAIFGWFALGVPLRLVVNLFFIWRAGH